ncbi:MAG: ATP-binding cassette domain-containing protein [Galactobacter sp.]
MSSLQLVGVEFGYGRRTRLYSELDLTLPAGKTVLLGPNGAGKSTLLGLLSASFRPQRGTVTLSLGGEEVSSTRQRRRYQEHLTWMPQGFKPVAGLTVQEHVAYQGWLKGLSSKAASAAAPTALAKANLANLAGSRATALSGGQTQRLGLAGAYVHDADVMLFDEPTAGLDIAQRDSFHELIAAVDPSRVVLISTHDTVGIEKVFDSVIVVNEGRVRFQGSLDEFRSLASPETRDIQAQVAEAYSKVMFGALV